eukprot:8617273-Lingulodinium_polyedra.AAC.1
MSPSIQRHAPPFLSHFGSQACCRPAPTRLGYHLAFLAGMAKGKAAAASGGSKAAAAKSDAPTDASRHKDRRDLECKSIRSIGKRYPSMSLVEMTEVRDSSGMSWVDHAIKEFEGKPQGGRLRDNFFEKVSKLMNPSSLATPAAKAAAKTEAKNNVCAKLWDAMKVAR